MQTFVASDCRQSEAEAQDWRRWLLRVRGQRECALRVATHILLHFSTVLLGLASCAH